MTAAVLRMDRAASRGVCAIALILAIGVSGCYVQQPLPRQPNYQPAAWEPILGLTTLDGDEIEFDGPATIEGGAVVGRVDGARYAVPMSDVRRLQVGQKTLDKPKTVVAAAVIIAVFVLFWRSIDFE